MTPIIVPDIQTSLHLRRTVAAPPERVFRAWTEPKMIEQWFKPMGLRTTVTALELRVGGAYRFDLMSDDGASSYIAGHYVEIAPPERLAFTWMSKATNDEQTLVTVEFLARGGMTEIVLTHDRLADETLILMHKTGWESCLDLLPTVL